MKQISKISPEVIGVSLLGVFILGYSFKVLLSRIFVHVIEISFGLFLAAGVYILILIWSPEGALKGEEEVILERYSFIKEENWANELINLSTERPIPKVVFPDSFVLSDSIDGLLEFIIRDFIQSWYSKFSNDKLFSSSIDGLLRDVFYEFGIRLGKVELSDFLVGSIMPLVTEHFSRYVEAVSIIREKSGGHLTQSKELDSEIASEYREKLYTSSSNLSKLFISKNFEYENTRKKWLNKKINRLLPLIILNKRELQSKIVSKLLIEIISNSILLPILTMTTDGDFWNQIVIKSAGSTIQDQNKVKRLRKALDQHTTENSNVSSQITSLKFTPNSDQNKFEKFIRSIYKCQSLAEARQIRYYISVQLQRAVKEGNDRVFINRLEKAKIAVEKQINILSGVEQPVDTRIMNTINPTNLAANTILSSMGRSSPVPMLRTPMSRGLSNPEGKVKATKIPSAIAKSPSIKSSPIPSSPMQTPTPPVSSDDFTLLDLLNDPPCSLYFMEYMEQRRHTDLLQFWLTVNSLRKQDDHINLNQQQDPLGGLNINEGSTDGKDGIDDTHGASTSTTNKLIVEDGTSKDDILQIYSKFYLDENHRIKEITPYEFQKVNDFVNNIDNATTSQYKNARNAILSTQNEVYKTLEIKYLPRFKQSDLYLKYLASNPPPINRINSTIDDLQMDAITNDESNITYGTVIDRSQNAKVVLAVEEAFQDIMSGSTTLPSRSDSDTNSIQTPKSKPRPTGLSELISEEFDADKNKKKALFDSDDDFQIENSDEEIEPLQFSFNNSNLVHSEVHSDVHLAAPGDLGLTEAISILSNEIDNLYNQEEVIDFLLKKAELTNNQSQLRILQKSKSSLEREIHRKELQRQQYIVQESDNSLFGKSDIQIQSYVHGVEDSGEYILYIIEVRKLDLEGNQTSGWIVARRYSQFFELHQHLKEQFSRVRKLDFPRKRVLLKFQPKSLVDQRRIALEKYLKELLKIPEVCQYKAFRLFLSSETFSVDTLSNDNATTTADTSSSGPSLSNSIISYNEPEEVPPPSTIIDANNELIQDKAISSKRNLFIQPICDLFVQVFGINEGDNWLRGRAVVVVIQQLLGGTIEKKFRDTVSSLTSIKSIVDIIQMIQDSVWPGGELKKSSPPRTSSEKIKTRHEAMILLQQLIHNASARVIGGSSSKYAARNLFAMYQNQILNTHLVYNLLDLILKEIFPELNNDDDD